MLRIKISDACPWPCKITDVIVKNPFGFSSSALFQLSVIYKSYTKILTPVNNSQLLLMLEIQDKLRIATFHKKATQRNYNIKTDLHQFRRNKSSRDLILTMHCSEAKHCQAHTIFTTTLSFDVSLLLCASTSLSQCKQHQSFILDKCCWTICHYDN